MLRTLDSMKQLARFAFIGRLGAHKNCSAVYGLSTSLYAVDSRSVANLPYEERSTDTHQPYTSQEIQTSKPTHCSVIFKLRDGSSKYIKAAIGDNLLRVAHNNDVDIEGACDASLACSTCHVILDPQSFDTLPEASEREEDLLDMAPHVTDTSRLSCQVYLNEEQDGMVVQVPPSTLNFYVDGHRPQPH